MLWKSMWKTFFRDTVSRSVMLVHGNFARKKSPVSYGMALGLHIFSSSSSVLKTEYHILIRVKTDDGKTDGDNAYEIFRYPE